MPEYKETVQKGMFQEFLIDPSSRELKEKLTEIYLQDQSSYSNELLADEMSFIYKKQGKNHSILTNPISKRLFGAKVPQLIIIKSNFLNEPWIRNDADIRSSLRHEFRHVKNNYQGLRLTDSYVLSHENLHPPDILFDYLYFHINELSAYYSELEDACREYNTDHKISLSENNFNFIANRYLLHWNSIANYKPTTSLEKMIKDIQVPNYGRIQPDRDQKSIVFNLFGKQEEYVL